jgi:D-alanine transaminase/branched-chain amino acid aminotransferase
MRLEVGYTKKELVGVINELIQRNQLPGSGIRLTLTGGSSPDGMRITAPALIITQTVFSAPSNESITGGIRLMTFEHQRQLPHVKTIDYIMPIWLQPLINQHRVDDVLYCHNGAVTECPRSNFFIVTNDNKVVTAEDHILKGITRAKVIALAKQHFEVEERTLLIREVLEAKEAFITSTTKKVSIKQ